MAERMLGKDGWSFSSHQTKPPPSHNGYSSKNFLQIILAAKWLVRHSSTSPKQQRRPLPSLLSNSSSMLHKNVYRGKRKQIYSWRRVYCCSTVYRIVLTITWQLNSWIFCLRRKQFVFVRRLTSSSRPGNAVLANHLLFLYKQTTLSAL